MDVSSDDSVQALSARLLADMDSFTNSERRVCRAILADYPVSGLESVTTLAHKSNVSVATVLRLVAKLGFMGFPQFQAALRTELSERLRSPLAQYALQPPSHTESAYSRSQEFITSSIVQTFRRLKPEAIDEAVMLLTDPRARVYLVGGRFSANIGNYLASHLQHMRPGVVAVSEVPIQRNASLLEIRRRDVVVAFDFRRYQRDTIDFGRHAAERGAKLLLVTDPWLSPLVTSAQLVIAVDTTSPSVFDSYASAFAVAETLIAAVADAVDADHMRKRMKSHDDWTRDLMAAPEV